VQKITGTVNNGTDTGGSQTNPTYSSDANGSLKSGGGHTLAYSFNTSHGADVSRRSASS
jgi:hypothetical protein